MLSRLLNSLKKKWPVWLCLIVALTLWAKVPKEVILTGHTMGTTYHIRLYAPKWLKTAKIDAQIAQTLNRINQTFSTYDSNSDISRFNRWPAKKPFPKNPDFITVMQSAQTLYTLSDGAWDPSVKPLLDLWGFSEKNKKTHYNGSDFLEENTQRIPSLAEIKTAQKKVGFDKITLSKNTLIKSQKDITIDLSAIAKGYGVDAVANTLKTLGIKHAKIEIGGEIVCIGPAPSGKDWKIGIINPKKETGKKFAKIIALNNQAMATSGDYENYFKIGDQTYTHIINAKTGYPIKSDIKSATVVAKNCMLADGLATVFLLLDNNDREKIAQSVPDIEIFLIKN